MGDKRIVDVVIGVDPDIDKSGVAVVDRRAARLEVLKMTFPDMVDYISEVAKKTKGEGKSVAVYVEAGWMNASNWHVPNGVSGHYGAAIGESVGRNQGVGMLLLQMLQHRGVDAVAQKPLPKVVRIGRKKLQMWRGRDGKITSEELEKVLLRNGFSPIKGRINQDQRDAVLIALNGGNYHILG